MNRLKPVVLRSLLEMLYVAQAHRVLGKRSRGAGAIFTLHHVRPPRPTHAFAPNRILDITPRFLEQCIRLVRQLGYDVVTLDEARERLLSGGKARKFVCFTLDDGYVDNLEYAAPVFDRLDAPFAVYVTTGLPDGSAVMWWEHLEQVVRDRDSVTVAIAGEECTESCRTTHEKYAAFERIYWKLRAVTHDAQQAAIERLLADYAIRPARLCRQQAMSWDNLQTLARNPRVTIGAHTVHHYALSKLSDNEVQEEAAASRTLLAERLGETPRHFCYPFGDAGSAASREFELVRDLGFATATTTRKGVLFPAHADHLHALPRISLNGDYQRNRYVELFLSGAPFALQNRFRELDVE